MLRLKKSLAPEATNNLKKKADVVECANHPSPNGVAISVTQKLTKPRSLYTLAG
jgi:hypothetical protein